VTTTACAAAYLLNIADLNVTASYNDYDYCGQCVKHSVHLSNCSPNISICWRLVILISHNLIVYHAAEDLIRSRFRLR